MSETGSGSGTGRIFRPTLAVAASFIMLASVAPVPSVAQTKLPDTYGKILPDAQRHLIDFELDPDRTSKFSFECKGTTLTLHNRSYDSSKEESYKARLSPEALEFEFNNRIVKKYRNDFGHYRTTIIFPRVQNMISISSGAPSRRRRSARSM